MNSSQRDENIFGLQFSDWSQPGTYDDFPICVLDTLSRSTLGFPVQENSVEVQVTNLKHL